MYSKFSVPAFAFFSIVCAGQEVRPDPIVQLTVPAGAPLRLYLTGRVYKKAGKPAQAKVLDPVFAFDREVIPAGSLVTGQVSRVQPLSSTCSKKRYRIERAPSNVRSGAAALCRDDVRDRRFATWRPKW